MSRKQPIPAFFDHYSPFVHSLENYTMKAGMLLIAAESFLDISEASGHSLPESLVRRLKTAIAEYKEAAHPA